MNYIAFISMILAGGLSLAQADPTTNPTVTLPSHAPASEPSASGTTQPTYPTQPGAPFRPTVILPNAITPQEWQELTAARNAAMRANPALMQKAQELSAKMRDFQQKLDAAIVKVDPNAAPIVERLEHGMPGQRPLMPLQSQHPGSPPFPPTGAATPPAH